MCAQGVTAFFAAIRTKAAPIFLLDPSSDAKSREIIEIRQLITSLKPAMNTQASDRPRGTSWSLTQDYKFKTFINLIQFGDAWFYSPLLLSPSFWLIRAWRWGIPYSPEPWTHSDALLGESGQASWTTWRFSTGEGNKTFPPHILEAGGHFQQMGEYGRGPHAAHLWHWSHRECILLQQMFVPQSPGVSQHGSQECPR